MGDRGLLLQHLERTAKMVKPGQPMTRGALTVATVQGELAGKAFEVVRKKIESDPKLNASIKRLKEMGVPTDLIRD